MTIKENKVLKLEHCAEYMVEVFFRHYLASPNQVYVWSEDRSCSAESFLSLFSSLEKPSSIKVESQVSLKENFVVNREFFSTHTEIKLDPNSCLDCALITPSMMIPVEVKSGTNLKDVFRDLRKISYSPSGELTGNMVKILNLQTEGQKLLQHKSSSYPDLSSTWMIIVRGDHEARKVRSSMTGNKQPVVMTLAMIQKYLEKHALTGIILEQIVKEYFALYASDVAAAKKAA